MRFTDEMLAMRRTGIGASEIGAIVGLNPYATAFSVWAEKVGEAEPFEGNDATDWGNRLEEPIARKYADVTGSQIGPGVMIRHAEHAWIFASPDRIVRHPTDGDGLLECKTASWRTADDFGEPGTDEVPASYLAQAQWQMLTWGTARWVDLAVLIDARDFRVYRIHRDEQLAAMLVAQARTFWFDHVVARVAPPFDNSDGCAAYIRKRWPTHTSDALIPVQPGSATSVLVAALLEARTQKAAAEKREAAAKGALQEAIGNGSGLQLDNGKITWRSNKPSTKTDASLVVADLIDLLNSEGEITLRRDMLDELISTRTKTVPGPRVFRVSVKGDTNE